MIVTKEYLELNIETFKKQIKDIENEISNLEKPLDDEREARRKHLRNRKNVINQKLQRWLVKLEEMKTSNIETMEFFKQDPELCRHYGRIGGSIGRKKPKVQKDSAT